MASTGIILGDTNRLRTSEVHHAVDDAEANGDLDRLRVDVMHPEIVAGEGLEPIHCILGKRSPVVATTVLLPFSTTVTGRCCINRARSVDVYAQRSRGQPPIKSDSRVTA
ncbi:MAG: hypothetical protein E5299_01692 [Burkholderia gladioli]|nr:MAG: hypothetical protein E5299_01692 [Burkholderia gladioli]